ncbi:hypothetical protein [Streptomyces sp. IB2014 016-6]|uniref:hypothetical protein n=1 Tax=Streptomyces sp. IB2014 016-6 TaxID=2517818 RepID=UPI0011C92918|nr:hypothetical protein [Streptomyces sp. IB2014 016-6]TXL84099.1 hypothetical protein EW053_35365 [Streptomyces sp. IB2014 016-6]
MKKINVASRTTAWIVASSGVMSLALAGCSNSEPKKEYKIPNAFCGMQISPDLVEPTLPPGKKLTTRFSQAVGESSCRVVVDKKTALHITTGWHEKGTTALKVAYGQIGVDLTEKISKDESYVYSDEGAVSKIACPNHSNKYRRENYELFTQFFLTDMKAKQSEVKALLFGLTKAIVASDECSPKHN